MAGPPTFLLSHPLTTIFGPRQGPYPASGAPQTWPTCKNMKVKGESQGQFMNWASIMSHIFIWLPNQAPQLGSYQTRV